MDSGGWSSPTKTVKSVNLGRRGRPSSWTILVESGTIIPMTKKNDDREFSRLIYRAYARDEEGNLHTGEALLLACLLHAKGSDGRKGEDMADVQRIMRDINRKPRPKKNN